MLSHTIFSWKSNMSLFINSYLANLMERKQDWSLLFRAGNIMRGHHTNNYAESNMCLIKDVILNRCKAYNTCQLIMLMNEIYNGYMKQRLLDVALCRRKMKKSMNATIPPEHVTRIDEFRFIVVSDTKKDVHYNVDLAIGMCDCVSGNTGSVCKHQIACGETAVMNLPQVLDNTPEIRHWLAGVAKGTEELPPVAFFSDGIKISQEVHDDSSSIFATPSIKVEAVSLPPLENEVASEAMDPLANSVKDEPPPSDLFAAAVELFSDTLHTLGDNTSCNSVKLFMKKLKLTKSRLNKP
ncbi:uncharacterized protein LOC135200650 [Macrobrachium nipponense]|uniref:uncharacterized protein LOC135200650 n=1 Tax=Macrobrachium nipponense TaxID=159736 RepID=UPI0030C8BFE3